MSRQIRVLLADDHALVRQGFRRILEDETDIANLIVWPKIFDAHRQIVLGAQMLVCTGYVQQAHGVVHLIANTLIDRSDLLNSVGGRDEAFRTVAGRGDEVRSGGGGTDSREAKPRPVVQPRDIFIPDLHIDNLNVKARNFR